MTTDSSWQRAANLLSPVDKTDKYGRFLITVTGLGMTGEEWLESFTSNGIKPTKWARDVLTRPDYNAKHRLEPGKQYTVALLFGKQEFDVDVERTTANLRVRGERDYGKTKDLRGELIFLIRQAIPDEKLECLGIWFIAGLHETIADSDGNPRFLASVRFNDGPQVRAFCVSPDESWRDDVAFAYPVSQ